MCKLFINADESLWQPATRSLRIDGVVSSIRLEAFFWQTLEEIAARDDMSFSQLITKLYLEALDAEHDLGNFTSFLRVCCARYLSLIADGDLNRDPQTTIADSPADHILSAEKKRMTARAQLVAARRADTRNMH